MGYCCIRVRLHGKDTDTSTGQGPKSTEALHGVAHGFAIIIENGTQGTCGTSQKHMLIYSSRTFHTCLDLRAHMTKPGFPSSIGTHKDQRMMLSVKITCYTQDLALDSVYELSVHACCIFLDVRLSCALSNSPQKVCSLLGSAKPACSQRHVC